MNFLITEGQLKILMNEGYKSFFAENMRILNAFTNSLINKVKRKFALNLKLLSTWGTSVGGLVLPLDEYIRTNEFKVDENQAALILLGVVSIIYFDNKSLFEKIYSKIKEEGLEQIFLKVYTKGLKLREAFLGFLNSLQLSITSISELISYSFLIPIILDIQNLVRSSGDFEKTAENITERIVASGLVLVSAEILNEVLRKISKRIK
jgi:hypothetical protein